MIFKQYSQVLLGEKTLTSRIRLPTHIAVGKQWAIVPKRAAPAWWLFPEARQIIVSPRTHWLAALRSGLDLPTYPLFEKWMKKSGYVQVRVRLDRFWQTPLQQMGELEAQQEGVANVTEYIDLWNSINKAKGARWNDNPTVWRIRFSLPQDVCIAVSKVGRRAIEQAFASTAAPAVTPSV